MSDNIDNFMHTNAIFLKISIQYITLFLFRLIVLTAKFEMLDAILRARVEQEPLLFCIGYRFCTRLYSQFLVQIRQMRFYSLDRDVQLLTDLAVTQSLYQQL